jgi:hypothetical protein
MTIDTIQHAIHSISTDTDLQQLLQVQESIFALAMQATTLDELYSVLCLQTQLYSQVSTEQQHELGVASGAWICDLPIYSEDYPSDVEGVWSFNDTHMLMGEGWAQWEIVARH